MSHVDVVDCTIVLGSVKGRKGPWNITMPFLYSVSGTGSTGCKMGHTTSHYKCTAVVAAV